MVTIIKFRKSFYFQKLDNKILSKYSNFLHLDIIMVTIIKFRKSFYFQKLFSRAPEFTSGFLVKPVLLIFLVLYVVLLRVFTF